MKTEAKYSRIWTKQYGDLVEVENLGDVEFDVEPTTTEYDYLHNETIRHFTPEKETSFTCTFDGDGNEFLLKSFANNTHVEDGFSEMMRELKELKARVNRTVALVHNCQRCGATLEVDEHKAIFCCKYCGATYLLGSVQPNSVYN